MGFTCFFIVLAFNIFWKFTWNAEFYSDSFKGKLGIWWTVYFWAFIFWGIANLIVGIYNYPLTNLIISLLSIV